MTKESIEQAISDIKEDTKNGQILLQSNLHDFIAVFHYLTERDIFTFKDFHNEIIKTLEDMVFENKQCNLVLTMPPRAGKSYIMHYFIAWSYCLNPYCNNIYTCYSDDLVGKFSDKIKAIMSNDLYRSLFGLSFSSDGKTYWKVQGGGETRAASMAGGITGFGAGVKGDEYGGAIFIDDPLKPQDARSEVMRNNAIDLFNQTLKSRRNNVSLTPMIVLMQRVHVNDLVGYITAEIEKGALTNWKVINVPALDENGDSFWEEKYPKSYLEQLKREDLYTFSAQYMQNPVLLGGNIIHTNEFKRWQELPDLVYTKVFADTAMTAKTFSDYSVFGLFGYDAAQNCYLIDLWRGKWEVPQLTKFAFTLWNKFKTANLPYPRPRSLCIENKASGIGLLQELRNAKIPIESIEPKSVLRDGTEYVADKVQRVCDVLTDISAGLYFVPHDTLNKPWLADYFRECQEFSEDMSHAHDDQVDVTVYALKERKSRLFNPKF